MVRVFLYYMYMIGFLVVISDVEDHVYKLYMLMIIEHDFYGSILIAQISH